MNYQARIGLFISLLIFTSFFCACSSEKSKPQARESKQEEIHSVDTVLVERKQLERTIRIPSELAAFREVEIYPRVQGFVKRIKVDRGSNVKQGEILIEIVAPELNANYREAQAKYDAVQSSLAEKDSKVGSMIAEEEQAQAQLAADQANFKRILIAAKTPGAVAPVDIEAAEKKVQCDEAKVRSAHQMVNAARSAFAAEQDRSRSVAESVRSVKEMKDYLIVKAPFDGIVSERNVHEGSLVGPSGSKPPMLKIEQISQLRLLVPVPETSISGVKVGERMRFSVSSYVGKEFIARVSRISHELDRKTRTMIVELDVSNTDKALEPGMYAEVMWRMTRPYETLFVPASAIVSKEDKTFVSRVINNKIQLVPVSRGLPMGKLIEIVGDIHEKDEVVLNPGAETRNENISVHLVSGKNLEKLLDQEQEGD